MNIFNKVEEVKEEVVTDELQQEQKDGEIEAVEPQQDKLDIDAIVEERVKQKLSEIIPQAKKEKEQDLATRIEEVEKLALQLKEKEENLALSGVTEEYKEFVKFSAQQKGITIDEYLQVNPQFRGKQVVKTPGFEEKKEVDFIDALLNLK